MRSNYEICSTDRNHKRLLELKGDSYRKNRENEERFILKYTVKYKVTKSAKLKSVMTIPVVVHILYNTEDQNISDKQIESQIRILNENFCNLNVNFESLPVPDAFKPLIADARIKFEIVSKDPNGDISRGITRTQTAVIQFDIPPEGSSAEKIKFTSKGGKDAWDTTKYMNIWVCKLPEHLNGYAQFPSGPPETDGIVIDYRAFGDKGTAQPPFHKGKTATHQVGHFLGLYHLWGTDQFLSERCSGTDNMLDTPRQAGPNFGNPIFPGMGSSCPDTGVNGTMFVNYMDYTDDEIKFMFTRGQVLRMHAVLSKTRSSILGRAPAISLEENELDPNIIKALEKVYDGVDKITRIKDFF